MHVCVCVSLAKQHLGEEFIYVSDEQARFTVHTDGRRVVMESLGGLPNMVSQGQDEEGDEVWQSTWAFAGPLYPCSLQVGDRVCLGNGLREESIAVVVDVAAEHAETARLSAARTVIARAIRQRGRERQLHLARAEATQLQTHRKSGACRRL